MNEAESPENMPWAGPAHEAQCPARSLEVAAEIGRRLADIDAVEAITTTPDNVALCGGDIPWDRRSLSHGLPGTILLFGELDRVQPRAGWREVAGRHLHALVQAIEQHGVASGGLHGGVTGVAFAVWSISCGGARYQRLLSSLDAAVAQWGTQVLEITRSLTDGMDMGGYDLMAGLAGLTRYLLLRESHSPLLTECLAALVSLKNPAETSYGLVPGWYVPAARQFTAADRVAYPYGNFNLGMAHGLAGVLAALALARLHGARVPHDDEAVYAMANWLVASQMPDEAGPLWPGRVALEHAAGRRSPVTENRPRWCYGAPGIARALYLAGRALGDPALTAFADDAFTGVFRRGQALDPRGNPGLCHGVSGLLQVTLRMATDTGRADLRDRAASLTADLVRSFDPESPFGYRHVLATGEPAGPADSPGMLDGAAGVAMSLASAGSKHPPIWDTTLLLA